METAYAQSPPLIALHSLPFESATSMRVPLYQLLSPTVVHERAVLVRHLPERLRRRFRRQLRELGRLAQPHPAQQRSPDPPAVALRQLFERIPA
jgi:hypothetical protein